MNKQLMEDSKAMLRGRRRHPGHPASRSPRSHNPHSGDPGAAAFLRTARWTRWTRWTRCKEVGRGVVLGSGQSVFEHVLKGGWFAVSSGCWDAKWSEKMVTIVRRDYMILHDITENCPFTAVHPNGRGMIRHDELVKGLALGAAG